MSAAAFQVGQRVRITDRTPHVHHRVPSYAKGQVGIVERVCGLHGDPERFIRSDGNPRQRIYRIRIAHTELWPDYTGSRNDVLEVEIFEHWLELMQ